MAAVSPVLPQSYSRSAVGEPLKGAGRVERHADRDSLRRTWFYCWGPAGGNDYFESIGKLPAFRPEQYSLFTVTCGY